MSQAPSLRAIVLGALGGVVATGAMTVVVSLAEHAGLLGRKPPALLTRRLLRRLGARPPRPVEKALTALAHVGFGAGAGALFGALEGAFDRDDVSPLLVGPLFGLAVWAVSYAGWIPAVGLMPPPSRDRPMRPTSMIAAHLVYGATLAATHRAMARANV